MLCYALHTSALLPLFQDIVATLVLHFETYGNTTSTLQSKQNDLDRELTRHFKVLSVTPSVATSPLTLHGRINNITLHLASSLFGDMRLPIGTRLRRKVQNNLQGSIEECLADNSTTVPILKHCAEVATRYLESEVAKTLTDKVHSTTTYDQFPTLYPMEQKYSPKSL